MNMKVVTKGKTQEKFEQAIKTGNLNMVRSILESPAVINPEKTLELWAKKGEHVVVLATRTNNLEMVKYILEKVPSAGFKRDFNNKNIYDIACDVATEKNSALFDWLHTTKLVTSLCNDNRSPRDHVMFRLDSEIRKSEAYRAQESEAARPRSFFSTMCPCFGR